jgi:hypothetical protein
MECGMSRILIVDAAEDFAMFLGALGHETEMAFDGWRAIEVFKEFQPEAGLLRRLRCGAGDPLRAQRPPPGTGRGVVHARPGNRGGDPHTIIVMANEFAQRRPTA